VALWLLLVPGPADRERRVASASKGGIAPDYADYVGDASCRDCHPGEYAAHTSSGHSKTLRPAARVALRRHWDGLTAQDPERPGGGWPRPPGGRRAVGRPRRGGLGRGPDPTRRAATVRERWCQRRRLIRRSLTLAARRRFRLGDGPGRGAD